MKSIFSENGNFRPHSVNLPGSKKREGGQKGWSDHKSMVTLWLVVLFALWVVLTTALAVTARHSKSRKTLQPPVIAAVAIVGQQACTRPMHKGFPDLTFYGGGSQSTRVSCSLV
jgi:Trk-type K+ transport system membrane component